jgi:1,2-phenylacetyl-CoA epoxidase PaaB subunit
MELELEGGNAVAAGLIVLLAALLLLGLAGRLVTPASGGEAHLLTPGRWTAYKLQKQARSETKALVRDAARLQAMLENPHPDPVEAMLLAQDIYARRQSGSSATAAARGALVAAAEATVRAAIGEISRDEAIASFSVLIAHIAPLSATVALKNAPSPTSTPFVQYLPVIQAP